MLEGDGSRCQVHLQQVRLSLRVEERRQDVGVQREQRGGRDVARPELESSGSCGNRELEKMKTKLK